MRSIWKVFRAIVSALLLLVVLLPAAIYVLLSIKPVQNTISNTASQELSNLLGADVKIGHIAVHPFNRATVNDISLVVDSDTIAYVNTVSASFRIIPLLMRSEIILDYALLDGVDFKIERDTPTSQLNIAPILSRLRSDNPGKDNQFSLIINSIVVRRANATYDVHSEAITDSLLFNPSHIAVADLAINADIPKITKSDIKVNLDHLSFTEQCGFVLKKLSGNINVTPQRVCLDNLRLALPASLFKLDNVSLDIPDGATIAQAINQTQLSLATKESYIYPPDLKAFAPILDKFDTSINIEFDTNISKKSIDVQTLKISVDNAISINAKGVATDFSSLDSLRYRLYSGEVLVLGKTVATDFTSGLPSSATKFLNRVPLIQLNLNAHGEGRNGSFSLATKGTPGNINIDGKYGVFPNALSIKSNIAFSDLNILALSGDQRFGYADGVINLSGKVGKKSIAGNFDATISRFDYLGNVYNGISLSATTEGKHHIESTVTISDNKLPISLSALYESKKDSCPTLTASANINGVNLNTLGIDKRHPDAVLYANINLHADDANIKNPSATAQINDLTWTNANGDGLKIDQVKLEVDPHGLVPQIRLESPYINGVLTGDYNFSSIVPQMSDVLYHFVPALNKENSTKTKIEGNNNFSFDFTLAENMDVMRFLGIPFEILDPATVSGRVNTQAGYAAISLHAPYVLQGSKVLENITLFCQLDTIANSSNVYATAQMPTKKGDMTLITGINCHDDEVKSHIDWSLARAIPLNGTLDFSAKLNSIDVPHGSRFPLNADISIMPGTINFGNDVWAIEPATINIRPDAILVDGFALDTKEQRVAINGIASDDSDAKIKVDLSNVCLLPIFETLEINNALIGGTATGSISASALFSGAPQLECPHLQVDSIGYNRCTIGDADILAEWDNERQAVYLDAEVVGMEGRHSFIDGYIFPMNEALDINFNADSVPVTFLKPFMEAFTSDISGRASGSCRLFGTFKDIDLEGEIFANNVTLKVDFTNTYYSATDSVHILPGKIILDDITIRDIEGHTAKLNGEVGHTFFRAPTFRFDISQANNLLSYNINSRQNPDWYGTIYGNGGATISGYPGVVNIGVNMTTAPNSTFTFVLSDRLDAEDYSFLTFRDATPDSIKSITAHFDDTPALVQELKQSATTANNDEPSAYNMDISVNITQDARVSLIMDPAGGDEIKATGNGNLHMAYHSTNNDLNMWGKYSVIDGSYRFTLQDIIIKDFIIENNSEISFDGDPYAAKTSLKAYYATNANLSDLDESFLQDKDIARTNVPVHALMVVTGDIRQPHIEFDLAFPTLSSDTYRKVKSIVSTEDMMNRQIIYLLALNRFYTPDYMTSTTKGSELFSVASSTLSSQLGNMLGKLSDNWSIAPNLRSDRGDFSDVEVDLALSSRLLNNRLLFNGNFGYRDNELNNNQFVGDFDIEYLLTKSGIWRLKAYNRYNDRNYYIRTAQTTQGVGIMFRRNFDSLSSFLYPNKNRKTSAPTDSTTTKQ